MHNYDVVIIGGGVIGLMAAYYLSDKGVNVCIFDKNEQSKQTINSWGFIRQQLRKKEQLYLSLISLNEWNILNYKSNNEIKYKKPGLSYFFKSDELKAVTDWNNSSKSFSCNNILLHPESGCDVFRLTTMNDGTVNPFGVYEFLNREIIRRKIPIIYDDYNLSRMNNSYLIQTKKERFNSKYLIISAGSGSRSILYELGIDIPMMTCLISSIYANNKYSFNENFVKNGLIIKKIQIIL